VRSPIRIKILVAVLAALLPARPARALLPNANASGAALYQRECAPCHGATGKGDGPEASSFVPPPRDLQAEFLDRYPENQHVKRMRHARLLLLTIDADAVEQHGKQMADAIADHMQRLPDVDWPLVRHGADVYAERCESCHGPYAHPVAAALLPPGPLPTGATPAADFEKALGDQDLLRIAQRDHTALPGFVPVGADADAKALVAYLRLLSPGFARYSLWCAACHGDEGHGDGVYATDIDKPNVVFDRAYLKGQSPAELRRKLMHVVTQDTAVLPHYQRELTAGQGRAIVAALRASRAAMPTPTAGAMPQAPMTAVPAAVATPVPTPAPGPSHAPRAKKSPPGATPRAAKGSHKKKHATAATPRPGKTRHAKKPTPKPTATPR